MVHKDRVRYIEMATSVWILGDQLMHKHPALHKDEKLSGGDSIQVLMIENGARIKRFGYQKKKIVLILSAMRHYAEKLRASGIRVDYRFSPDLKTGIIEHVKALKPERMVTMAASEYRGREFQNNLDKVLDIPVKVLPNTQFLTGRFNPIPDPEPNKPYVQERFYRKMRQHFDLLLDPDGEPIGGQWNFDKSNRSRLPKDDRPPALPDFNPDRITLKVMHEIEEKYQGVGAVEGFNLAVSHDEALLAAQDFFDKRLKDFGAYEDAMSSKFDTIYHSRLSAYLNLGLLDPLWLVQEAQKVYEDGRAPINSVEGFVRQVVGWREFIYWQYWRQGPALMKSNYWGANRSLPVWFWNGNVEMNCLNNVIKKALQSGYNHHIERLMIVCNFCLLAGIDPVLVNRWFLSVYIDAYEWVMLPNVFGMGMYADGGITATKPYIASSNYINKMSDYCWDCAFERKKRTGDGACPYNFLYWNFMLQNEHMLRTNPRMSRSLLGLKHLSNEERLKVQEKALNFLNSLE